MQTASAPAERGIAAVAVGRARAWTSQRAADLVPSRKMEAERRWGGGGGPCQATIAPRG